MLRFYLLAGATLLGAGSALAQVPASDQAALAPNPSQGQYSARYGAGPASNNNNNSWGVANTPSGSAAAGSLSTLYAPNTVALPTPGTIVIRLNGRVEADVAANYTSTDRGLNPNGTPNGYKVNPVSVSSYMRLYPGVDGIAANGLRYGATMELRENFGSPVNSSNVASSPSADSSGSTVFVRRAFAYLASDQLGLVRIGQGDGVVSLFDPCIFTSQCWDAGITGLDGGAMQAEAPTGATGIPFVWLSGAGAEYANSKIVYLSPQFYGFDFGVQYAPSMGNGFQASGNGVSCNQAGPACIGLTSGGDPTRWYNQVGVGVRYQHNFGTVDFKAFGFYETAGKENLTTAAVTVPSPSGNPETFRYDNLSFYEGGVAVTAYNVTVAATYVGGAVNGSLSMRPTGGAPMSAVLTGVTYANGPFTLGAQFGIVDSQGDARLTHVSQRHEYETALGGTYKVAPGLQLVAEYMYTNRHQGGFDFNQNAPGVTRDAHAQGLMLSTVLTW